MVFSITDVDKTFINKQNQLSAKPEGKTLLEACSSNISLFSEHMLGLKLYSWQSFWLNRIISDDVDTKEYVALTSRQIGKSTATAILCLWSCVFNKFPSGVYNNTSVGVVSATDTQAKKLLHEIKRMIVLGDRNMKDKFGKEDFFSELLSADEANNTSIMSFSAHDESIHGEFLLSGSRHGSTIKSYAPTAIVLGETFSLIIVDEAAKTDKISDQFFYDYLYPTGNSTNATRVYLSTPWVCSGFFYRMVDPDGLYAETDVDIVAFTIEAIELENPSYYNTVMKTIGQFKKDGKLDEVNRGYMCAFVQGDRSYFDPADVNDSFNHDTEKVDSYSGLCDLGIDFGGQVKSKTVLTVTALDDDENIVRLWHKTYGVGKDLNLLDDIEQEVFPNFNIQRIIPDDCPAGDFLIRQMQDKGWNVTPMNFRSEKVKKYGAFRAKLKRKAVHCYEDDNLRTEMLALENSQGSRQSVIQHAVGYSDDHIDSFLLSCYHYLVTESKLTLFDQFGSASATGTEKCRYCDSESIIRTETRKSLLIECRKCGRKYDI